VFVVTALAIGLLPLVDYLYDTGFFSESSRMPAATSSEPATADPRRWITLVIILSAVLIAALDTTVLNVAIPTILRDFDTTLPKLQWVITGYSLTFAALLIIGGRLADIHGARTIFMIGAGLFAVGSLVAALSTGVVTLVIGEAVIEGIGASLMLPATLGILTSSFHGRERATAFAAWGAVMGAAVALGPLLGGFLTTNYSWRWAFVVNVIIAPTAVVGALVFMREAPRSGRRERIDVPGALLISSGMLLLVFGISEGATYGWWRPLAAFTIAGVHVWPASRAVSIVPIAFVGAVLLLTWFVRVERAKERAARDPLFEFSHLRRHGFRYGLATLVMLAMGQTAFLLVISVLLQDGRHLTALDTGLWLVPSGVFIVIGAQGGAHLTRVIGTTGVVRAGLLLEAAGLGVSGLVINPGVTFLGMQPGFALLGLGIGFAGSQLTNVILSDIEPEKSGAASGANSTVRMIGNSLGVSIMSALLSVLTIRHAADGVRHATGLSDAVRAHALTAIHHTGIGFRAAPGTPSREVAVLSHTVADAVANAARTPLFVATAFVTIGLLLSLLIPPVGPPTRAATAELVEEEQEAELMAEAVALH
jgi:EmrB/QacA subfamily drug resistance transporter